MNIKLLNEELELIKRQKEHVLKELEKYKDVMNFTLVQKKSNGCYQYYYRDENRDLKYIASSERDIAKRLAQKEYYEKLLTNLFTQEKSIEKFINKYNVAHTSESYEVLAEGKKRLVQPIIKTDEEFIEDWNNKFTGEQNTFDLTTSYTTNKGEEVRSKSEKILADLFDKHGVIYKYEPEITLFDGRKSYPDFALLNLRERKTFFWEHFGLGSDAGYSEKNIAKLAKYEKSKIVVGDNLIVTAEATGIGIDVKIVEDKIKKYLI